jgi:hypothetical protein
VNRALPSCALFPERPAPRRPVARFARFVCLRLPASFDRAFFAFVWLGIRKFSAYRGHTKCPSEASHRGSGGLAPQEEGTSTRSELKEHTPPDRLTAGVGIRETGRGSERANEKKIHRPIQRSMQYGERPLRSKYSKSRASGSAPVLTPP